jgi:NADPH-dependent 2,4-dienoyl-CoA reductase/sulfur reductase-like enzyme
VSLITREDHVVVVGAGLAGWRLCEALRREGYAGRVTLIGDEADAPYDRPPLSKQVLAGAWAPDHATLATAERIEAAGVEMLLGVAAESLDVEGCAVRLSDGRVVAGSRVVVATGSRARTLAYSARDRVHTLRRRSDALSLIGAVERLAPGTPVVVIGGGFIGAEVATALRARGLAPIVLEEAARPLMGPLGEEVSGWLAGLAASAGVDLRNDQRVRDVVAEGDDLCVRVGDENLTVPVVVVGAGALPNVEWLANSGLELDNGVVVDEHHQAAPRIAAIGDVARFAWPSVAGTELIRIEHWENANLHAAALARHWTSGEKPAGFTVPYFWSEQYGRKIQMLGHPHHGDDATRVLHDEQTGRFTALYSRDGLVTGVVTLAQPRALMLSKVLLDEPTMLDDALARAPWRG